MDQAQERAIQWECEHLLTSYYNQCDHWEFDECMQAYAPDCKWRWRDYAVSGREEMLKEVKSHLTGVHTRHLLTNVVVKVIDEDHAESLSYVTIYTHKSELAEDGSAPLEGANYIQELHDKFVRLDDGWHIAEREVKTAFERRPK